MSYTVGYATGITAGQVIGRRLEEHAYGAGMRQGYSLEEAERAEEKNAAMAEGHVRGWSACIDEANRRFAIEKPRIIEATLAKAESQAQADIEEWKKTISNLKRQLEDARRETPEERTATKDEADREIQRLNKEIKRFKLKLREAVNSSPSRCRRTIGAQQSTEEVKPTRQTLWKAVKYMASQREGQLKTIVDQRSQLAEKQKLIEKAVEAETEARQKLENCGKEVGNLRRDLNEARKDLMKAKQSISHENAARDRVAFLEGKIRESQAHLAAEQNSLCQSKESLNDAQSAVTSANFELKRLRGTNTGLQTRIDLGNSSVRALQSRIQELEAATNHSSQQQAEILRLQGQLRHHARQAQEAEIEIRSLRVQVQTERAARQQHFQETMHRDGELRTANAMIVALQGAQEAARVQQELQTNQQTQRDGELATANATIATMRASQEAEREQRQRMSREAADAMRSLRTQMQIEMEARERHSQTVFERDSELAAANARIAALRDGLDGLIAERVGRNNEHAALHDEDRVRLIRDHLEDAEERCRVQKLERESLQSRLQGSYEAADAPGQDFPASGRGTGIPNDVASVQRLSSFSARNPSPEETMEWEEEDSSGSEGEDSSDSEGEDSSESEGEDSSEPSSMDEDEEELENMGFHSRGSDTGANGFYADWNRSERIEVLMRDGDLNRMEIEALLRADRGIGEHIPLLIERLDITVDTVLQQRRFELERVEIRAVAVAFAGPPGGDTQREATENVRILLEMLEESLGHEEVKAILLGSARGLEEELRRISL